MLRLLRQRGLGTIQSHITPQRPLHVTSPLTGAVGSVPGSASLGQVTPAQNISAPSPLQSLCYSSSLSQAGFRCMTTITSRTLSQRPSSASSSAAAYPTGAVEACIVAVLAVTIVSHPDIAHAEKHPPPHPLPSRDEVAGVRAAINQLLDEDPDLATALVGLAWALGGSYHRQDNIGGSDDQAVLTRCASDADLSMARDSLKRVAELFPGWSEGDLWTFAGVVAVEHMGGPPIHWRPGRRAIPAEAELSKLTTTSSATSEGGFSFFDAIPKSTAHPNGLGDTVRHVRETFARQGFTEREAVALMGAHAICRSHPGRTEGAVYSGIAPGRADASFGNEYFRCLLDNTWTLRKWDGPDVFENATAEFVVYPADMALLLDKDLRKHVETFAKDEDAFFGVFSTAFQKLGENGVHAFARSGAKKPWYQFW